MIDQLSGVAVLVLLVIGFIIVVTHEIRERLELERRIMIFGRGQSKGFSIADIDGLFASEAHRFPKGVIEETIERLRARRQIIGENPAFSVGGTDRVPT